RPLVVKVDLGRQPFYQGLSALRIKDDDLQRTRDLQRHGGMGSMAGRIPAKAIQINMQRHRATSTENSHNPWVVGSSPTRPTTPACGFMRICSRAI
ncbi:hypothetical protein, partial [Nonomuraea turcica]|uniref:hypothetical protein n=1 Tax=Nonomuraea sp. G32 TaxID=3067274 RepID=UPI00273AA751